MVLGLSVKKRWDSLRNCFARELRAQTNTKSGQAAIKRRKYVYFDRLLFLLSEVEHRPTESNLSETRIEEEILEETDNVVPVINESGAHGDGVPLAGVGKKRKIAKASYEDQLLEILKNDRKNTVSAIDEDSNFALSLVPTLKSIPEHNKIRARIEILNVLQNLKYNTTVSSPMPGSSTHSPVYNQSTHPPSYNQYHSEHQIMPNNQNYYNPSTYGFPSNTQRNSPADNNINQPSFQQLHSKRHDVKSPMSTISEQSVRSLLSNFSEEVEHEDVN